MYWSLGNEIDGWWQMGHKNADDYSKYALEAAKLMKWTSPEIKLIAAGSSNFYGGADPHGCNRTVLDYLKEYVDYIALHLYLGNRDNDYYSFNTCFKCFPKGNMDCKVLNCARLSLTLLKLSKQINFSTIFE